MEIDLRSVDDGVLLPLKVSPGSKQNSFRGVYDGAVKVSVTTVAEKGKANKAVLAFLAKQLSVAKSDLAIESGTTDSRKVIKVSGVSIEQLTARLSELGF